MMPATPQLRPRWLHTVLDRLDAVYPIVRWRYYANGWAFLLAAIVVLVLISRVTGWRP